MKINGCELLVALRVAETLPSYQQRLCFEHFQNICYMYSYNFRTTFAAH